jgi:hypothetical protein
MSECMQLRIVCCIPEILQAVVGCEKKELERKKGGIERWEEEGP